MELSPEAQEIKRKKYREYQKAWRKKNPEKNAINQANYWENLAKRVRAAEQEAENENKQPPPSKEWATYQKPDSKAIFIYNRRFLLSCQLKGEFHYDGAYQN